MRVPGRQAVRKQSIKSSARRQEHLALDSRVRSGRKAGVDYKCACAPRRDGEHPAADLVRCNQVAAVAPKCLWSDGYPALDPGSAGRDRLDHSLAVDRVDGGCRPGGDRDEQAIAEAAGLIEGNPVE